jgi:acetyl esterase/lipase
VRYLFARPPIAIAAAPTSSSAEMTRAARTPNRKSFPCPISLTPINIYYGADELLVGEALEFADRAKAASLDVSLHSVPAGQHLFLLGAGRVPETDAAIAEMG